MVRHGGQIFDMDHEIVVLLEMMTSRDSRINLNVESVRLHAGCTNYHEISSIEAREKAIEVFVVRSNFVVSRILTYDRLLYESNGAGTWLTVHRAPQVCFR